MIHPDHRIVVDYGNLEDIILLSMVKNDDGKELSLDEAPVGLNIVERHIFKNITTADDLLQLSTDNAEGFVIRFENGLRAKVKFEEYKHLHALITGTSSKSVWRVLRDGQDVSSLFEKVQDEFADFVREWIDKLTKQRDVIIADGKSFYEQAAFNHSDRKGQAIAIQKITRNNSPERAIAMMYMAGQPERALKYAWQAVEPEHVGPPFADEG